MINYRKNEWEERPECSDTTLLGYWAMNWGNWSRREGVFAHTLLLEIYGKEVWGTKRKHRRTKRERLPKCSLTKGFALQHPPCVLLEGDRSALRRGRGWRLVFASFVLAAEAALLSTADLRQGCLLMQGGTAANKSVWTSLSYTGYSCSCVLVDRHY